MKPLLAETRKFQNECETVFSKFRLTCMHLRKEPEALGTVDQKEVVTRYIGILCKQRPFLHDRCEEVLRILMLSDEWMKAFIQEAELDINHLPPNIKDEFRQRFEEVKAKDPEAVPADGKQKKDVPPDPWSKPDDLGTKTKPAAEAAGGGKPSVPKAPGVSVAGAMRVVVQRCLKAKLMTDERAGSWDEIGNGLFVAVSFSHKAEDERIAYAARFLLTAKLSTSAKSRSGVGGLHPGRGVAESVASLCQKGESQGILLVPQSSLDSEFGEGDTELLYPNRARRENAERMYNLFIESLCRYAKEVATGPSAMVPKIVRESFGGPQVLELMSAGPAMHSFVI